MTKLIADLVAGDVITAFVQPDGQLLTVRGGPFEVASVAPTGGAWEGARQFKITGVSRTRAPRYSNGSTHVVIKAGEVEDL